MLLELAPLRELTFSSIILRFLVATICGSVIGFERGKKLHSAGLRTHVVVCVGSASVMILNQFLITFYGANSDPARLGAQVISGIGFLGAGTIVITGHQRGQHVKGLTTAAGLWASACMGLVAGSAYYEAAIIMCIFLYSVIVLLDKLNARFLRNSTVSRLYIEYKANIPFSTVLRVLRENQWHLSFIEPLGRTDTEFTSAIMEIQRTGQDTNLDEFLGILRKIDGVLYVTDA